MKVLAIALALAVAGCGLSNLDAAGPDGPGPGSGTGNLPGCVQSLGYTPTDPVAGPSKALHVSAQLNVPPVGLHYGWEVQFNGAVVGPTPPDSPAIEVPTPMPGVYVVSLDVPGLPLACSHVSVPISVAAPGAQIETVRLRIVPPRSVAVPPTEKFHDVKGGAASDLGTFSIASGKLATPMVMGPSGGVPAYLQFSPGGEPEAIVEAFSDASGAAAVQLVLEPHSVLVVPSVAGIAPRRITGWRPDVDSVLRVDAGSLITGTVRDPADAPLPGATVQLAIDGVPSTLATTAADGSFALRAATGVSATVLVTPPDGSGLPRLSAISSGFDLTAPLQIRYAANVVLVDLAGTTVRRLGAPVAGARLMGVGSLATAGTVTAGTQAVATGEVRIAATTDAGGALPSTRMPAAVLSAVVEVAPGDLAVVALDTSAGAPATLDALPRALITTAAQGDHGAGLPGAVLELVPTGALAMAGAPTLRISAGASGVIAMTLPAGGQYHLRFADPMGRRAPLVVPDRAVMPVAPSDAIAPSYTLPAAVQIHGTLRLDGGQALANASVQLLCQACSGIERTRPLIEVASDAGGGFTLAVPDPGTR